MDFLLVHGEKREVVKVQHLPVGRPVLHALDTTLDDVIVIVIASIARTLLDPDVIVSVIDFVFVIVIVTASIARS